MMQVFNCKLLFILFTNSNENMLQFITNEGPLCIFKTNKDSPNYRLIQVDLNHPEKENWITLLPVCIQ